jgi:hypothetical protein
VDHQVLQRENQVFSGTRGVSQNNRSLGFRPAFLQQSSGRVEVARLESGIPAPMHIINWLPGEWAASRGKDGAIESLVPGIVAGFLRDGRFYTREETAALQ